MKRLISLPGCDIYISLKFVGFQSNCKIRTEKAGGSIKIRGSCSSRLIIKMCINGERIVTFWKTHVGHKEEIRSQRLSKMEQSEIVEKLKAGVSVDRIVADARDTHSDKLERIHLLHRKDVQYLAGKHNVQKKRHVNDMMATVLKVQEWNAAGKNYAFIFKAEGEGHPILEVEDFALGFMNATMENKLRNFGSIICMDGTHCTNRKGMDLTVMLVKDDKNAGFPVAFFLSNRQNQIVQEVFLGALKDRIGTPIQPAYFMTDDDPKYYNAWCSIMAHRPRRLLCTWHVVKNWNIQGKAKIIDSDIKKSMKIEMKKILTEINIDKFNNLWDMYFRKLDEANEIQFLNYLKKYYFQSDERIHMWAHCYRLNAGINTSMAIESLNNDLKTNYIGRRTNITVEKLLDAIEDLVDNKMWQRILHIERPTSQTYQDKVVIRAHKAAVTMDFNMVSEVGFGEFQVRSSHGRGYYNVSYNELCEQECKTLFCYACKICIHRYKCECQQYAMKTTICKHVHLVCLYEKEKGDKSVLDNVTTTLGAGLSNITQYNNEEIDLFMAGKHIIPEEVDKQMQRQMEYENIRHFLVALDDEDNETCIKKFHQIMKEYEQKTLTSKRKMKKQEYYPSKKKAKKAI